ncbi:M50 family metallopeptidase [Nocardioides speluncae]|uniref:M50 family metallopeptidase n=1 Tax=Nocardioides speluncae TaxID=2670337 RepID=UPI000D68C844|nr:site-2 protease family protein [Nocardioides speluncae]
MTAVYYTLGVLFFVFAILASIGLHELGHMIPAKKFGGKVTQYFIGFGPTVWSKKKGETEYGVKAIPLGGYVKIVGMLPPGKDGDKRTHEAEMDDEGNILVRKSNTGLFTQLISDARAAEWETISKADHDRLFYKMAWWKKVVVMAGGPTVNILIAFAIFGSLYATYGNIADTHATRTVGVVSECVLPATEANRDCTAADPKAPAAAAGLKPGDKLLALNGTELTSWEQAQKLIRGNDNGELVITYERDGVISTATTNTTVTARRTSETDETLREVGFLGVAPTLTDPKVGGPLYTLDQMGTMTVDTVKALGQLPVKVFDVAQALVGLEERAEDSPVSIVGGGRIAGEVSSHEGFPVKEKLVILLMLIAAFNFFIGMFNFVPLLPLDGGHIAGALYEAARRGASRLLGRPDPGHVDVAKMLPVAYVVAISLAVMGLILIVADLVIPVHVT